MFVWERQGLLFIKLVFHQVTENKPLKVKGKCAVAEVESQKRNGFET